MSSRTAATGSYFGLETSYCSLLTGMIIMLFKIYMLYHTTSCWVPPVLLSSLKMIGSSLWSSLSLQCFFIMVTIINTACVARFIYFLLNLPDPAIDDLKALTLHWHTFIYIFIFNTFYLLMTVACLCAEATGMEYSTPQNHSHERTSEVTTTNVGAVIWASGTTSNLTTVS